MEGFISITFVMKNYSQDYDLSQTNTEENMILLVQIIATARAVLGCDHADENLREDKRNAYWVRTTVHLCFANSTRRNTIKGQNTNLATICGLLASHSPSIHSCPNLDGRNTLYLLAPALKLFFHHFIQSLFQLASITCLKKL